MRFAWDPSKNLRNQKNHGVSFEEAVELFRSGVDYLEMFDEAHSTTEDRFIAIGPIARGMVLVVSTEQDDETTRIISARWATKRERELYREFKEQIR